MTVDLTYSDTEDALRESLRSLLASHCVPARVGAVYDGDDTVVAELWQTVSRAMELPGLGIADLLGGGAATSREVAIAAEELGRFVAPIPFLTSSVIATRVLTSCSADDLARSLVDGSHVAVLAAPWSSLSLPGVGLPRIDADSRLEGGVRATADAHLATVLLVPATRDGILTLCAVERGDGVQINRRSCLDMTRQLSDVELSGAVGIELARGQAAAEAIQSGLLHGAAMLASEQVGLAEWCLEQTVEYAKQRHQFGRAIGSFQSIKHRLARLWIAVGSARAAARNAAVLIDGRGREAVEAVALAQSYCSDVAVLAAEECIQIHGGIGMTWEHPAHLYLKRAKADQVALGSPAHHRAVLAQLQRL